MLGPSLNTLPLVRIINAFVYRYERDKVVSFVPPDGQFELMKYRVHRSNAVLAPCYCQPQFNFNYAENQGTVSVMVGPAPHNSIIYPAARGPLLVEDVVLVIPFSKNVRTTNLIATVGSVLYDEVTKVQRSYPLHRYADAF